MALVQKIKSRLTQISNVNYEENYEALQEYNNFQRLVYTKEYLTKDEYDFCITYDKSVEDNFLYIGNYSPTRGYLNLNVYTEHDHEKRGYELEIG